ncbi:ROK family protein [Halalkalibacter hemicellulosilyticus]|uniref:Glucokinase n=1 Tax=Halalkalibacter hemicellulosilyticusJCM 9152 TaxID=1236971 RepID=W4QJM9_9BACI|nr:ROK family glucokinase [Halalkalibacter hemicellulosilyticus]GAE32330.1 glucokinase [Halalkalibacter hemicellulosilyticusJCM 9152]
MYLIGVDLGGTQIRAGLFTELGDLIKRESTLTQAEEGPDSVIKRLISLVERVSDETVKIEGKQAILGIGIGSPGPLDVFQGTILSPPNLPGWVNIPLRKILEEHFNVPVYLNNDANAAALGEYYFGAGKGKRNMVYMTISTGVGTGILDNGHLLLGVNGSSAEVGHMSLNPDGPVCGCGNRGCLEAYTSGTGIMNRTKERLRESSVDSILREKSTITSKDVFDAAKRNDELALEIVEETRTYLGVGLVNVIHLYNPELIIFGGGVSKVGDYLFNPSIEFAREKAMKPLADHLQFKMAQLGDDVGLIGAAALVKYNETQS